MKLPVFKAVGMTFAFVFGKLGDVIRILWLPYLILTAASMWFVYQLLPVVIALFDLNLNEKPDPQQVLAIFQPLWAPCGVLFLASLIFMPMQYAGLLRFLVKGERPGGIFYLQFGRNELNILLTYIVVLLITVGLAIVFGAAEGIVRVTVPGPTGELARHLINLVRQILNLWIGIKLSLAFAAAIGIGGIGIGRSWSVVKGNWWNLFGFYILLGIIYLLVLCAMIAPFAHNLFTMFKELAGVGRDAAAAKEFARQHLMDLQFWLQHPGQIGYAIGALHFVVSFLLTALGISAPGVAYRLITEDSGKETSAV
ncbi:MAG: hypothetical protein WAW96_10215 [Alphaproteobacteria bacterium]